MHWDTHRYLDRHHVRLLGRLSALAHCGGGMTPTASVDYFDRATERPCRKRCYLYTIPFHP